MNEKKNLLSRNDEIIAHLRILLKSEEALNVIPGVVEQVIKEGMWKERIIGDTGKRITYNDFLRFIQDPPLDGLGTDLHTIYKLCEGTEAGKLIENLIPASANVGNPNTKNEKGHFTPNVDISKLEQNKGGTSRLYIITQLKRDAPDIAQDVISGKISAAEGKRKLYSRQHPESLEPRPVTIRNINDPIMVAKLLSHHCDHNTLRAIRDALDEYLGE